MKRFVFALAVAAGFLVVSSQAQATSLPASSTVGTSFETLSGGTLIDSITNTLSFPGSFTATLTAGVYREAGGTLTFLYQLANSSSSADPLHRVTNSPFTGFLTDVGWASPSDVGSPFVAATTGTEPLTADRFNGPGGNRVVGFFDFGTAVGGIDPGETSPLLVIRTDASAYTAGRTSVIDGGVVTFTTFAPTGGGGGKIPEPSSLVLLGGCLAGLVGYRIRRWGKGSEATV